MSYEWDNCEKQSREARNLRLRRDAQRIKDSLKPPIERREPWYQPILAVILAVALWAILYTVIHLVSEKQSAAQFYLPLAKLVDQVAHLGPTNHETE